MQHKLDPSLVVADNLCDAARETGGQPSRRQGRKASRASAGELVDHCTHQAFALHEGDHAKTVTSQSPTDQNEKALFEAYRSLPE